MDETRLSELARLADVMHDQNAARLRELQGQLDQACAKRAEILKRPGHVVEGTVGESTAWQAQAIWSNSADAKLRELEANIRKLEQDIAEALIATRKSFTKVKGLENLRERATLLAKFNHAKSEEVSQEALVKLRDQSARE